MDNSSGNGGYQRLNGVGPERRAYARIPVGYRNCNTSDVSRKTLGVSIHPQMQIQEFLEGRILPPQIRRSIYGYVYDMESPFLFQNFIQTGFGGGMEIRNEAAHFYELHYFLKKIRVQRKD